MMWRVAFCLAGLAAVGCTSKADTADIERTRAYIREVTGDDLKAGGLRVQTTDVTTDGHVAKVRGRVTNNFDQTVEGVRYVVSIYGDGPDPKVLDRWQYEVDTTIAAGDSKMMRLDVESMYFGRSGGGRFGIEATPVTLGGKAQPPPAGWH